MADLGWVLATNVLLIGVGFACGWFARTQQLRRG